MQVVTHDCGVAGRRRRRLANGFELLAEMAYLSLDLLLSYLVPPLPIFSLEFRGAVRHGKTRVMGLPCGAGCRILTSTVFVRSTRVTDRRPDRIAIAYTRYSIYAVMRKNGRENGAGVQESELYKKTALHTQYYCNYSNKEPKKQLLKKLVDLLLT